MTYAGEHALAGNIGHSLVIVSFVFALISGIAYFMASGSDEARNKWLKPARLFFFGHAISSLAFIFMIFFLLVNHYYEFDYIYEQSSEDMSFRYLLVCFWGGQEGSFMLWIFWHVVLGTILVFTSKKFEPQVMAVFCLVQVFLVSMLLGVYIGDLKIGSSPFALRRHVNEVFGPLWNLIPDYFTFDDNFKSGDGLNPLLRNYWMTIHPPTLFLGFALTVVPFCYAVAGAWTRNLREWIKPALPWTYLGIMILGGGILMGGRWAYESLSFGGFWAWDPVENASLVPWIFLVGAAHLMLINRHQSHSLFSTFLLTFFSFILILLSTFLTRSGILGDSSVHSFTGEDMMGQLLLYMMFFVWLSVHLLLFDKKLKRMFGLISLVILLIPFFVDANTVLVTGMNITVKSFLTSVAIVVMLVFLVMGYTREFPKPETSEESFSAREFWMFVGAIVLVMGAFHIAFNTSLPAINQVYGSKRVISQDERNAFYNMYQVPFAIVITLLMGYTQFLKYRKTDQRKFFKEILFSAGLSLIACGFLIPKFSFQKNASHAILLFTAIFSVLANLDYFLRLMKGKLNHLGASLAHVGFGLVILGSLISQANQQIISKNYKGYIIDFLDKDGGISNNEDVQLFLGEMTSMGEYFVVYREKRFDDKQDMLFYDIDYLDQLPLEYKVGDRVRFNFQLYECNVKHIARDAFMKESGYWKPIEAKDSKEFFSYPTWESHKPGKVLFTLTPFIQMNKMQNVPEPGTQHFWTHDIFTHIKYADLSPINTGKMQALRLKGKLNDTLWTAGYKIIFEDVRKAESTDSLNKTMGATLRVKVLDLLDNEAKYPMYAEPEFHLDSAGNISSPVETINPLGLEFRLIDIHNDEHDHSKPMTNNSAQFELEFVTKEYIVLHAKKFPLIIILWWGCIIMCLGTLMAVIYRIRKNRIAKN